MPVLPYGTTFKIRWDHQAPPPFACLRAGTVVDILEYHKAISLAVNDEHVECENIAKVRVATPKDASKAEGYVNAIYVEPAEKQTYTEAESSLISQNLWGPDLIFGRWYFGVCSPLDVAHRMLADPSIPYGHFALCQPSELTPTDSSKYPSYLLVIKLVTGAMEQFIHEWTRDEEMNYRFRSAYPKRQTFCESLPMPPKEPVPSVAYLTIARTETGLYQLEGAPETFHNIFTLLARYRQKQIEANFPLAIQLIAPACVSPYDAPPPRPLVPLHTHTHTNYGQIYPSKKCTLNIENHLQSLLLSSPSALAKFVPRISVAPFTTAEETSESGPLHTGFFKISNRYKPITIRKLNDKRFNAIAFQEDLTFVDMKLRPKNSLLTEQQRKALDARGSVYLLHLVAYNTSGDSYGKWLAYEYEPGLPLDQLLRVRKFEADFVANRTKYEVVYQVSAAMRFLELNGLCHRHLKAANVIVVAELPYLYRVKLTDYMLPYHFLNKSGAATADLADLDWPWWAPEIFETKAFNIQSDVWAFGCVIFELMSDGLMPYGYEKKPLQNKDQLKDFLNEHLMTLLDPSPAAGSDGGFIYDVIMRCFKRRPTFADADMRKVLKDNVSRSNYKNPTPVQKHSLPILFNGRDLMSCAQTGSGKTAAFLLPMINKFLALPVSELPDPVFFEHRRGQRPLGLVLAPTRELAMQIFKEATKFAHNTHMHIAILYGGRENCRDQINRLSAGCNLLIATPGRLIDMIEQHYVCLDAVQFLVLDEADRMLDMGFEPQIRYKLPPKEKRITAMFSATFPRDIQELARDFLKSDFIFITVGRVGSTTENITQNVMWVEDHEKRGRLIDLLRAHQNGLVLVFVETKRGAEDLTLFLRNNNVRAIQIHGDLRQAERERNLYHFRIGNAPILVATAVAARGLDIPNVMHVINFDIPSNIDEYVHRIGRTGRAGNNGLASSFFNDKNTGLASDIRNLLSESHQAVPDWLASLPTSAAPFRRTRGRGNGGGNYNNGMRRNFTNGFASGNNNYKLPGNNFSNPQAYRPASGGPSSYTRMAGLASSGGGYGGFGSATVAPHYERPFGGMPSQPPPRNFGFGGNGHGGF